MPNYQSLSMLRSLKKKAFIILTIAIAVVDVFFVALNISLDKDAFTQTLEDESNSLIAGYELLLSRQEEHMLTIATLIANQQNIVELFYQGKLAVEKEGGGAGGEEAAKIRNELYRIVGPAWLQAQDEFDIRQLHFHLGPGAVSFLRVNQPEKFGDTLDEVRHTVVDTNSTKIAQTGFETGRVQSGILGVVPVWYTPPKSTQREYVGALEVGTSFSSILSLIDETFNLGAAVFLTQEHVSHTMWKKHIDDIYQYKFEHCNCYLEATTRNGIIDISEQAIGNFEFRARGVNVVQAEGNHYAVVHFPLFDYFENQQQKPRPIGSVVFWKDVNNQVKKLSDSIYYAILFGLFGFIIIELMIYFAINIIMNSLNKEIVDKAHQLHASSWELNLSDKAISNLREGVVITDKDANIIRANKAVTYITGYSNEELVGSNPKLFSSGQENEEFYQAMWDKLNRHGFWNGEILNRKKDGQLFSEQLTITAVKDQADETQNYVAIFSDITNLKAHQKSLEKQAFYDPLTGLPNRILLGDRFSQVTAQAKRYRNLTACIFIDLDEFKPVNDTYGHKAGDFLLVELADRMNNIMRGQDTLARIGGDEFIALVSNVDSQKECEQIVQRMLEAAREPIKYEEHQLKVSASIGVLLIPHDVFFDQEKILNQADQAMYEAKENGRDRYVLRQFQ